MSTRKYFITEHQLSILTTTASTVLDSAYLNRATRKQISVALSAIEKSIKKQNLNKPKLNSSIAQAVRMQQIKESYYTFSSQSNILREWQRELEIRRNNFYKETSKEYKENIKPKITEEITQKMLENGFTKEEINKMEEIK